MTYHDTPRKNRFVGAVFSSQPLAEAAKQNQIPRTTASRLWKKFVKTGSTHTQPRSGRPPKVTPRIAHHIVQESKKNRRMLLGDLGNNSEIQISGSTVRRVLADNGRHRRKACKVVLLTKAHRRACKAWATRFQSMTGEDWHCVIWSDESYIYISDKKGTVWVTRAANEVYNEDCVVLTFKQSSIRVMVWGCIMERQKGPLVVLEYPGGRGGGMTAKRYQDQVLDGPLHDFYQEMSEERGMVVFQEDGAPSHRAKSTREWLQHNSIDSFPHPASSPDLSPIEPLWKTLKDLIRSRPHPPTSLSELKHAVREAWDQITPEHINTYVRHMEERVAAVLAANGGHTMY